MEKKTDQKKLDNNLDFDDLEDIDSFDVDLDGLGSLNENERKPSVRKVATEIGKEAGKGFLETLITKSAEKSLPESYSANYYVVSDYTDFIKETFQKNRNKINKSLYYLGKEVKKILPFQSKILNSFLEKYSSDLEEFKAKTEEEIRENSIQSTISSIFDRQLEITKAIEAKKSAEEEVERKRQISVNKINLEILSNIDSNISNQTAFTLQVSKEYYRKSLELQYKSYFVQADILKEIRAYYKGFSKQFEDIQYNTSLPDYVKLQKSEAVGQVVREQVVTSVYKQIFSNFDYIQNLKKKAGNYINEKTTELVDKISGVTDILANINQAKEISGGDKTTIATVLSGMLGSTLGEKVADKISPKIKDVVKDNKYINTGANYLNILSQSPRTFFTILRTKAQKAKENYIEEDTPTKYLASKILGGISDFLNIADPGLQNPEIKEQSILNHNKPAIFDNKVHRSITEVIPMYLAKILKENTTLRKMYRVVNSGKLKGFKDSEELVYDYQRRTLSTKEDFITSIQKSVFKDLDKESTKIINAAEYISSLAQSVANRSSDKEIDKSTKKILSDKKAQKAFQEFMSAASTKIADEKFNYETLVTNINKNSELLELVSKDENLKNYIKALQSLKLNEKDKSIDERVKDSRRVYPVTAIIELFNTAAELRGRKSTKLSSDSATFISKTWLKYIYRRKTPITLDSIVNAECFRFMTKDYTDEILSDIKELVSNCSVIKSREDTLETSRIELLISMVNESLTKAFEFDPKVFQILHDYSQDLVKPGKLDIDNLVKGKIGIEKISEEYIDNELIREIRRGAINKTNITTDNTTKINNPKDNLKQNFLDKVIKYIPEKQIGKFAEIKNTFQKEVNEASGVKDIVRATKNMLSNVADTLQESTKEAYRAANKKLTDAYNELNKMFEEKSPEVLAKIKNKMRQTADEYIKTVDKLISSEEEAIKQEEEKIRDISKELQNLSSDQSLHQSLLEVKNSIIESKKREIEMLKEFKKNLQANRNEILSLIKENLSFEEFQKRARGIFSSFIKEAKETLAKYET